MNQQAILERFLYLLELSPKEAQPWQGMREEIIQELNAQVLTGVEEEAVLLNAVVAALAFYRYSVVQSNAPESDFTAGDVRVIKGSAGMEAARRLWLETRRAATPHLRDEGFYFRQVCS